MVHLPRDKKKKVGCNLRILRLTSEGLVWRWSGERHAKEERQTQEGARKCLGRGWGQRERVERSLQK